jgi:oxygen-dependent protoporphyrinogen oxidase
MKRICVVGGGVGGLTCARALVAAGYDVIVREAAARPGGVVQTSTVDGFVREHAASSFLGGPPDGALALCGALGVAVERASAQAKRRWIFAGGKLRAVPRNPAELVTTDLLTWRGKLALLGEPLRARARGTDESMYELAARRLGPEVARAIIAPFVTGVFAADAREISAAAGFPRLAALDAAGGFVRGSIAQLIHVLAARARGGQGAGTPAKTARGLWAPVGGVGALVDALADELAGRIRTRAPVAAIAGGASHASIDGERVDGAVIAIPAQDAAPLVAHAELAARLAAFDRAPSATVFLGLPAAAVPVTDGFGLLVAQGEELRVLGVVFESVVWPERAPAGQVLLRCIFGGGRDRAAAALDDAALIAQARHDVGITLGIHAPPVHASVVRSRRGVAQYAVGHRDRVAAATAIARTQRIALAGADYRGPGLNDLCADAAAVVAEVRAWG